jgi:hypothetical protein
MKRKLRWFESDHNWIKKLAKSPHTKWKTFNDE